MTEAVIQFRYTLAPAAADAAAATAMLAPVFAAAQELGVIGRDAARYDGLAFGNLSYGSGDGQGFWITATQTADRNRLSTDDIVYIESFCLAENSVAARGSHPPSSEALSHAAIHAARPDRPTWVLHGHAPSVWNAAEALGWPVTDRTAANGTLAMARAVAALAGETAGLIIMGGHTDGVLAYAGDGSAALALFAQALDAARSAQSGSSQSGQHHARH
ncbi:MAG: class II aldolase/adducin family protein [Gammaproteobacteria bacterium]|nr:class II aldolase/adducin family protein [Gammaproteobacteria bacterium]